MIVSPSLSFRLVHSLAAARSAESLDGTEGIERGILSIVPAATQIGTEAAANALLGGAGTFLRGISSGGANAAEYRYQAGDDYDSQKAALRMALSAGGVAAGSALSGAVNALSLIHICKITVIDGETAYTGGVNIADEYANLIDRFGYWKDSGIRLEGEGVCCLLYTSRCV